MDNTIIRQRIIDCNNELKAAVSDSEYFSVLGKVQNELVKFREEEVGGSSKMLNCAIEILTCELWRWHNLMSRETSMTIDEVKAEIKKMDAGGYSSYYLAPGTLSKEVLEDIKSLGILVADGSDKQALSWNILSF